MWIEWCRISFGISIPYDYEGVDGGSKWMAGAGWTEVWLDDALGTSGMRIKAVGHCAYEGVESPGSHMGD